MSGTTSRFTTAQQEAASSLYHAATRANAFTEGGGTTADIASFISTIASVASLDGVVGRSGSLTGSETYAQLSYFDALNIESIAILVATFPALLCARGAH